MKYVVKPYNETCTGTRKVNRWFLFVVCFCLFVCSIVGAYRMGVAAGTRNNLTQWAWTDSDGRIHAVSDAGQIVLTDIGTPRNR